MTEPAVYVSFPQGPDRYPAVRHWHAQLSHFVWDGLARRFGSRVVFVPWDAPLEPAGRDAVVTFTPHPVLAWWKRSVCVENSNFDVDKWRYAAFRRYGLNAPLDQTADSHACLNGQYAAVFLSNDVTLRRIRARDPQVTACYDDVATSVRHLSVHSHPIDKVEFSRLFGRFPPPSKVRMLVYHGGPRKNSAELIATLGDLGLQADVDFSVAPFIAKDREDLLAFLLQHFPIVANTSFSETGPINMLEYLVSGHLIYGHDDWWDGAGNERFCWSYDPALMERNRENLRAIFRGMSPEDVTAERDRVRNAFLERTDNEWPVFTAAIGDRVEALLESSHPGRLP